MKTLIIGYGSIGRRHAEILGEMGHETAIVSRHADGAYRNLKDAPLAEYDYFVIASETSKHLEQLKYIDKNVKNRLIFCEKPLFMTYEDYTPKNNRVYVGYVLRFHPVLMVAELILKDENILSAEVYCGSYLPDWRKDTDYRRCYSAKKAEGGGVLLDLSHEIDYARRLFGEITVRESFQGRVSNLEIDSDDTVNIKGCTDKGVEIAISLDYTNPKHERFFMVTTENFVMKADFSEYMLTFDDGETISLDKQDKNRMYEDMHRDVLGNAERVCTYEEGMSIMKTISQVQEQNR